MNDRCSSRPISWLKLEQYCLGELSREESAKVKSHLGECPVCKQCAESIREPGFRLPALPPVKPRPFVLRWVFAGIGLAAAAVLVLVLVTADWERAAGIPPRKILFKGGELSLSVVREREGEILHEPETFAPGDRFKLLVTCPPGEKLSWQVVVFQDRRATFPLTPAGPLPCGNRVALPGAFQLTGKSPALVCLMTGPQAAELRPASLSSLPENSLCLELRPVP